MDDEKIIELFNIRSEQALLELDSKYGKLCKSISFNILHCNEDVEECINDSYLGIWHKIPPAHPNPLAAFVCRIVKNISLTKYNRNKAKKRDSTYDICLDELGDCISTPNTVESEFNVSVLSNCIDDFLDTLNSTNRIIFIRRYWFFDDFSSISAQLGISEGSIRVRLARTREKMKLYLQAEGFTV